ncbi:MAG: hypothetical protein HRT38_18430 [Alteromonadaceae bacterium]|nr:hypothetical protein [Alteromonadaceae bacterium]
MNRRFFLKSIIGTSITLLGGVTAFQWYQNNSIEYPKNLPTKFLTQDDQLLITILVPVMLGDLLVSPDLDSSIVNIDEAIIRLPLRTQAELRELFDLLGSSIGRMVLAGVWLSWQKAAPNQISAFLTDWRESNLSLLQQAYTGLHQLMISSVYAEPQHWEAIGYPGPPKLV